MSLKDSPELLEAFEAFSDKTGSDIKAKAALTTVPMTVQYVTGLLEQGINRIIIYTDHVEACNELAKAFKTKPIHGQIRVSERNKIADAWKANNDDLAVLCATYGSYSTGVNLTESHHTVLNDAPWVPGVLDQAYRRTNRMGQIKTCYYHRILASKQSKIIYRKLEEKKAVISQIV
jgi:SNF2 family DNA or RNA helicase